MTSPGRETGLVAGFDRVARAGLDPGEQTRRDRRLGRLMTLLEKGIGLCGRLSCRIHLPVRSSSSAMGSNA